MTFFSRKSSGTLPLGDFLGEAFDDRGLADAGFAEQYRIVFRPAAEHLDDALDFVMAADDRIEFALLRADSVRSRPKAWRAGVLTSFFRQSFHRRDPISGSLFRRRKIGIEFLQNLVAGPLDIDLEALQNPGGDALTFAEQAEQNVLGSDVGMIEGLASLPASARTFFTRGV